MQRKPSYDELFQRNYGIFSEEEQDHIRRAHVMATGCGGVGGTAVIELCRCGVENFTLVEPDVYSTTNINRQISCYMDTLGKNKAEALKEDMMRINDECDIRVINEAVPVEDLERHLRGEDVLVASADDFAYSIVAARTAKKLGIPSVIGLPVGSFVRVWTNVRDSPPIEDYFALPKDEPDYRTLYDALYCEFGRKKYARWAQRHCDWGANWADGYAEGKISLSQIAPMTWLASSLVALEVIKLITHRWEPVVFPRYWKITPNSADIDELHEHR
jgi:hypothetical protein